MKLHLKKHQYPFLASSKLAAMSAFLAIVLCLSCLEVMASEPETRLLAAKSGKAANHLKRAKKSSKNKEKGSKSADKSELIDAWKLTQSSNLIGPLKMIVSDKGVRLNAPTMGLVWIFKAPNWDAYLYNVETKNYCSFKYEIWKKRGFFMSGTSNRREASRKSLKSLKVKRTGKTTKIANMKVEQVYFLMADGTKYGEFWITSKITVPNQFKELVASMLRLPPQSGGTPLKAAIIRVKGGELSPVLDTQTVVHSKVKPNLFNPLKGYKRVKDEMALLFSDTNMFGSGGSDTMFGGKPLSGSKKKK